MHQTARPIYLSWPSSGSLLKACFPRNAIRLSSSSSLETASNSEQGLEGRAVKLARSVEAIHYEPLKLPAKYGLPVCNLQLRSYHVPNLEFYTDFALRAAFFLNLPASGPTPLPKRIERWTVPRGPFVHKKSQENFERITHKRLIQIKDGNINVVERWLAFLAEHPFYGIGMKANMFGFEELSVGSRMGVVSGKARPPPLVSDDVCSIVKESQNETEH